MLDTIYIDNDCDLNNDDYNDDDLLPYNDDLSLFIERIEKELKIKEYFEQKLSNEGMHLLELLLSILIIATTQLIIINDVLIIKINDIVIIIIYKYYHSYHKYLHL